MRLAKILFQNYSEVDRIQSSFPAYIFARSDGQDVSARVSGSCNKVGVTLLPFQALHSNVTYTCVINANPALLISNCYRKCD